MKVIFGGIYRNKKNYIYCDGNDQHYGYWIPAAAKDKDGSISYKMVDTYMVDNPCWGKVGMDKRLWYLEQANCGETSWQIYNGHKNYYYQNVVFLKSDELNENEWELIADLHDYEAIDDEASRDYHPNDLLKYVPLWNEDCYRWDWNGVGKIYVRKGARKDGWQVYNHAIDNIPLRVTYSGDLNELEKICNDVLDNMILARGQKKQVKNMIKKIKKYRKLMKEYESFCKELK